MLALESAYREIRKSFAEGVEVKEYKTKPGVTGHIPEAVIVINSSTSKYGHYARSRWSIRDKGKTVSEIMIGAEGLRRSAREVLGTLLHEAVHGICHTADVQDVSGKGKYHNKAYKRTAEQIGLIVHEPHKVHGHNNTELPEGEFDELVALIEPKLVAYREFDPVTRTMATNNGRELSVRCHCPRKIRVYQSVRDEGPILCGVCGDEFE